MLDDKKLELRFNSEWLSKLKVDDLIRLMAKASVQQIMHREDFSARQDGGIPIGLHELLYPLLQGYDSVAIKADIEIGGTDQTFNMLMGRDLQVSAGQAQQTVITMPLIPGTDGTKKMSKSLGNYIGILEPADQMYGKLMSLPDDLILPYMQLVSDIPEKDVPKRREDITGAEMQLKHKLALSVTCLYRGENAALKAQDQFRATFQSREFPKDAKELTIKSDQTLFQIFEKFGLFSSKSEARRKLAEGAVRVDGKKISDGTAIVSPKKGETIELKIGKLGFYRVTRQ